MQKTSVFLLVLLCVQLEESLGENIFVPLTYSSRTLTAREDVCPPSGEQAELQTVTDEEIGGG